MEYRLKILYILSYSFFGCSTITKTLMTLLVSGVVFPCKAEVVNIFQVLIISACVMRVGTLVIILRNINDLANGVRAQGGSILQQVGQYRAGGIGCTRAIGLKDTTQPSCQWRLMEGIILLLKSTFTLDYETSKSKCYLFIVISLFIIIFPFFAFSCFIFYPPKCAVFNLQFLT